MIPNFENKIRFHFNMNCPEIVDQIVATWKIPEITMLENKKVVMKMRSFDNMGRYFVGPDKKIIHVAINTFIKWFSFSWRILVTFILIRSDLEKMKTPIRIDMKTNA